MKYVTIAFPLCALLLFSNIFAATQQENIAVSTSEGAAMSSLRALLSAETKFQTKGGEYGDLKELYAAGLIDDGLASGLKGGYRFTVRVKKSSLTTPPLIDLVARPSEYGKSGRRSFYLTESGVLLTSEAQNASLSEMHPFANEATQPTPDVPVRKTPLATEPPDEEAMANDVASNEAWAMDTLQLIHSAETAFKNKAGAGQYGTLEQLEKQRLLVSNHAAATQSGYVYEVKLQAGKGDSPAAFSISAVPQTYGVSGRRSFYIDQTGSLRGADKEGGAADAGDPAIEK